MKKLLAIFSLSIIATNLPAQSSWVEVRNEERHHLVFENNYVRILDVFIGPGDTTRYHRHNTASVFIQLSTTKVVTQLLGGQPIASTNVFAQTITFDSLRRERIHRVGNVDTNWMHVMDVEITASIPDKKPLPLKHKQLVPQFSEAMMNGYKLTLSANETVDFPGSPAGYLVVSLGSNEIEIGPKGHSVHYFMKAGHYSWIGVNEKTSMHNQSNATAEFAVLQF